MLDSGGRRQGVAMSSLREAEGPVTVVRAGGMMGCYRAKGVGSPIWLPSFTLRSRSGVATRSIEAPPEFARNPVHVPRPHPGRPPSSSLFVSSARQYGHLYLRLYYHHPATPFLTLAKPICSQQPLTSLLRVIYFAILSTSHLSEQTVS